MNRSVDFGDFKIEYETAKTEQEKTLVMLKFLDQLQKQFDEILNNVLTKEDAGISGTFPDNNAVTITVTNGIITKGIS